MRRPDRIRFVEVSRPGRPTCLVWGQPPGMVEGYLLLFTRNPFPPELASEIWAGRMQSFVHEARLPPSAVEHRTEEAAPYYALLAVRPGDVLEPIEDLREDTGHVETPLTLAATEATQERTFVRARWTPPPVPGRDREIHVWRTSDAPRDSELVTIVSGAAVPHYVLDPSRDGFIDTVTERGFRVHYVAVVVDASGGRRPLRLVTGGFQRLQRPAFLEDDGLAKLTALMDAVVEQLEIDLQLSETSEREMQERLLRADDLYPGYAGLGRIRRLCEQRFGGRSRGL